MEVRIVPTSDIRLYPQLASGLFNPLRENYLALTSGTSVETGWWLNPDVQHILIKEDRDIIGDILYEELDIGRLLVNIIMDTSKARRSNTLPACKSAIEFFQRTGIYELYGWVAEFNRPSRLLASALGFKHILTADAEVLHPLCAIGPVRLYKKEL